MNPPVGTGALGSARTIAERLGAGEVLSPEQAVSVIGSLAAEVAARHAAGKFHGGITPEAVTWDGESPPRLCDAVPPLGGTASTMDAVPPALRDVVPLTLPAEIDAARAALESLGVRFDPRQIDFYQLGALLCRLVTGESADAYLRSPRVKGKVPARLRSALERSLGCDGRERFADAGELGPALHASLTSGSEDASSQGESATDDTTPSVVSSGRDAGEETSVGPGQSAARSLTGDAPPFARLGHYEIVSRIGHGGMGDVYRGYERALDRSVAIKVLPAELAREEDFIRRFRAEATAAARLIHPNVIQIHFIGEDAGHHFFAMQYVEGESLASLLSRRAKLPVDETLPIVEQALSGLAAAHKQGLIHRDIKPGNILLDRENRRALLADFGLVKSLESSVTGKTATGVIMGTVDYISPEQGRGHTVDGRSDLYSLGVLLYRMLSGRLPFEAENATALIFQHVYEQAPSLKELASELPSPLVAIVEKLMRKGPADRHQTADEVLADLRAFRSGERLPSGADKRTARQTTIIRAPEFEDAPLLPEGLGEIAPQGWWAEAKDQALSLFRRHAPEAVHEWQNTQQQVAGAIGEHERRQKRLEQLAREADSVLAELRRQVQAGGEREELERQIADQEEQRGAIELKRRQAIATVQQLRNQRDILNARLKAAKASLHLDGAEHPESWIPSASEVKRFVFLGAFGVAVFLVAVYMLRKPEPKESLVPAADVSSALPQGFSTEELPIAAASENTSPTPSAVQSIPEFRGLYYRSKRLAVSRDAKLVAVVLHGQERGELSSKVTNVTDLKVWKADVGSMLVNLARPHALSTMAFSPDGNLVTIGTVEAYRRQIWIWDFETGAPKRKFDTNIQEIIGFSPDGKLLYGALGMLRSGDITLVDLASGKAETFKPEGPSRLPRQSVALSPVEDVAAVSLHEPPKHRIELQNFRDRSILGSIEVEGEARHLVFSGDGRFLAGTLPGRIVLWSVSDRTEAGTVKFGGMLEKLSLSQDGSFAGGLQKGRIGAFDFKGKTTRTMPASSECYDLAFDANGLLVVAPDDAPFGFFDPATGKKFLASVSRN